MGKKKTLGAALIEYGLLAGLISLIAITAIGEHGRKVRDIFLLGTSSLSDVNSDIAQMTPPPGDVTPSSPAPCPATVSIDGQDYGVVQIGTQCWMSENLNVATSDSSCYDNQQANCDIYGRMYPMVELPTHLEVEAYCPSDWHLAGDTDWLTLERELGMSEAELDPDATDLGYSVWRTTGDVEEQIASFVSGGTNSSGLNLLAGGYKFAGTSNLKGNGVIMLSAGSMHWRYLRADKEGVNRRYYSSEPRYSGYARCVMTRS